MKPGEFFLWSPDAFKEVAHFRSPLTLFDLSTVTENEIPFFITEELRQRFSEFCKLPENKFANAQQAEDFPSQISIIQPQFELKLRELQIQNETLKRQLEENVRGSRHNNIQDQIFEILEKADFALDIAQIADKTSTDPDKNGKPSRLGRRRIEKALIKLMEDGSILRARDGRRFRYFPAEKEYLPEARIFENVLYPEEIPVLEAQAENIFSDDLRSGFFGQEFESILDLKLVNYPIWRFAVSFVETGFFSDDTIQSHLYLDALTGKLLDKDGRKLTFARSLLSALEDNEDPFEDTIFTSVRRALSETFRQHITV